MRMVGCTVANGVLVPPCAVPVKLLTAEAVVNETLRVVT